MFCYIRARILREYSSFLKMVALKLDLNSNFILKDMFIHEIAQLKFVI